MSASEERCPDCGLRLWRDGEEAAEVACKCRPSEPALLVGLGGIGKVMYFTTTHPSADHSMHGGGVSLGERTKETVFTVRMRHPSDDDPTWTALVDGPDGAFDVGVAGNPDEALSQVIDTIALHDFGSDGDDDRYRP